MSTAWPTVAETKRCTNDGVHGAHPWRRGQCPGATPAQALTICQIEVVANALGLDVKRTVLAVAEAIGREGGPAACGRFEVDQ